MKKLILVLLLLLPSVSMARIVATITSSGQLPYTYTISQSNSRPGGEMDTILLDGVFHVNGGAFSFDGYTDSCILLGANWDGTWRDSIYFNEGSGNGVTGIAMPRQAPFTGIKGIAIRANPSDSGFVTAPIPQGTTLTASASVTAVVANGSAQVIDSCSIENVSAGVAHAVSINGERVWGTIMRGNTIKQFSPGYWRRDLHDGYVVFINNLEDYEQIAATNPVYGGHYTGTREDFFHVRLVGNTITSNASQGAIRIYARGMATVEAPQGLFAYAVCVIDSNYLTVDADNNFYLYPSATYYPGDNYNVHYSSGNSYGVLTTYAGAGHKIRWNTIRAGTNYGGGRGIYFASNRCYNDTARIEVSYNSVIVHRGVDEYYGNQNSQAFEARQRDLNNFWIHNNHFKSQVNFDGLPTAGVGDLHTGPSGYAFRWEPYQGESMGCVVENNTFEVEEVVGQGGTKVWTVTPSTQDQMVVNMEEHPEEVPTDLVWRNNTVIGPDLPSATLYCFGGYNGDTYDLTLQGDTAYYTADTTTKRTIQIPNRFIPGSIGRNNILRDIRFGLGAAHDDIYFAGSSSDLKDITIQRSATIYVYGNNGLPVQNAHVEYENAYVDPALLIDTTTGAGTVYANLNRYYASNSGSPLDFSPYTLRAIVGTDTAEVVWAMTDANRPDTIVLTNTLGTGTPVDNPPAITNVSPAGQSYQIDDTAYVKATFTDDYAISSYTFWWVNTTLGDTIYLRNGYASYTGQTSKVDSARVIFSLAHLGSGRPYIALLDTAGNSVQTAGGALNTISTGTVQANTPPYISSPIIPSGVTGILGEAMTASVTVRDTIGYIDSLYLWTDGGLLYMGGMLGATQATPTINTTWKAGDVPSTYVYMRVTDDSGVVVVDSSLLINTIYTTSNGMRTGADGLGLDSVVIFIGDVRIGRRINLQGTQ